MILFVLAGLLAAALFLYIFIKPERAAYFAGALYQFSSFKDFSKLFIVFGVISFLVQSIKERRRPRVPAVFFWIFMFTLYCLATYLLALASEKDRWLEWGTFLHSPSFIGLNNVFQLMISVLIMLFIVNYFTKSDKIVLLIKVMIVFSTLACLYSLAVYLLALGGLFFFSPLHRGYGVHGWFVLRSYGTAVEPLAFSNQILVTLPILFCLLLDRQNKAGLFSRPTLGLLVMIQLIALLITFSLGAFLGLSLAMIYILAMSEKKGQYFKWLVLIGLVIVALYGLVDQNYKDKAQEYFVNKLPLMEENQGLPSDRSAVLEASWNMFRNNLLTGVGFGNLAYSYRYYAPPRATLVFESATFKANNDLMTILAETGIIGLVLYLTFIMKVIINSAIAINRRMAENQVYGPLLFGLTASVIAVISQSTFGYFFQTSYQWLLIGTTIALTRVITTAGGRKMGTINEDRD